MSCRTILSIFLLIPILAASVLPAQKQTAQVAPVKYSSVKNLRQSTGLALADTCFLDNADTLTWSVTGWIIGDELYKVYLDPAQGCENPYPFTITEVHIILTFADTTTLIYEGDIEAIDWSDPSCPLPDTLIAISPTYQDYVPGPDAYDIWVELDPPVVVDGPFFAGFYLGSGIYPGSDPAIVTDNHPQLCNSYNIWDESIGWVDMMNTGGEFNFPGRMAMYVLGIAGGSGGTQPEPELTLVAPSDNSTLFGSGNIWASESSGSGIIDYVSFEYSSGGGFVEIGRDFDGSTPLRDGTNSVSGGNGFSYDWDFSALSEGNYTLRATAVDTLGRSSADSVAVYLEPTPPTPTILSPENAEVFCDTLNLLMSVNDEDIAYIDIKRRPGSVGYSAGLTTVDVSSVGNHLVAPGAAALATYLWGGRGYEFLIKEGTAVLSVLELTDRLATSFDTYDNNGTYDEDMLAGLDAYFRAIGNALEFDYRRNPSYFDLRIWLEEQERAVIIALSGDPGTWLAVDGFPGWTQGDGSYLIRVSNPLTGAMADIPMRNSVGINQVNLNGSWQNIDLMVSLLPKDYVVNRVTVGADFSGGDGWFFGWAPFNLDEDSLYYFTANGHDGSGHQDATTVLLQYACQGFYVKGDYDGNQNANISDLVWLIDFLTAAGPAPVGGAERADANCDGFVNIADIVYYMNFTFGVADPPCH
ncbi:MAG: hypothetical protein OEV68_02035 [candidate division Zixibacteria bacterium]|nr:hypothetical protein [candidate division Zixibacteria bacterium]